MGPGTVDRPNLKAVILLRASCDAPGVTQRDLGRDVQPFAAHKLTPGEWRAELARAIDALVSEGMLLRAGSRLTAAPAGIEAARRFVGASVVLPGDWERVRDIHLIAKACGLEDLNPGRLKSLATPDGLRARILERAFGFRLKGPPTPARVRNALAVVALERAFGDRIKGGFGAGEGISGKMARRLAGQLSRRPRDFGTDKRLVATLAAEQFGGLQSDLGTLRLAVLRGFLSRATQQPAAAHLRVVESRATEAPQPPQDAAPLLAPVPLARAPSVTPAGPSPASVPQAAPGARPAAAIVAKLLPRPDLKRFAAIVIAEARRRAEGWAGNRKAFISHVWQAIREGHPEWGLSEIEFKCMLAEAHRTGHLTLANADLKEKRSLKDLQDSAVAYKNTEWHFIRVQD